jgi:hypothetical protein
VTIPLNQDLTVRWAGGGSNDFVAVNGYSFNSTGTAGTGFVCSAPNSAGSVTVSAPVLSVLPASSPSRPGVLEVIDIPPPTRSISGSGLENIVDSALNDVETVEYQ